MVVLPGGGLAMGRYEVTVGEYRAFVSATGGTWRRWRFVAGPRPLFSADGPSSGDVRELGRRAGVCVVAEPADGRDVSVADGGGVGAGGIRVSGRVRGPHGILDEGTCPVGTYGSNAAGLSDMVGNQWEWTSDCWEGDCGRGRRVVRGGSWVYFAVLRPGARVWSTAGVPGRRPGFSCFEDA